jgi:tetratricopeptide (TPR) repeat protein
MRLRWMLLSVAMLAAAPSLASMSGGSSPAPPPPPSSDQGTTQASSNPDDLSSRQKAEHSYADAYEQIAKAKEDIEAGKDKNAQKKFKQALESAQEAVRLDPKYYEAWNAVGYSSRKLGNYDDALKAYAACLDIKPDYAPAREYLGEAYIELGQLDKAREQLVMLDHFKAVEESKALKTKLDAWQAAHPDSSSSKPTTSGAGK